MKKSMKVLAYPKVMKGTRKCDVCGITIDDANYYLRVKIEGKRAYGYKYIHDNEGRCLERLKVSLGLMEPTFKSALITQY